MHNPAPVLLWPLLIEDSELWRGVNNTCGYGYGYDYGNGNGNGYGGGNYGYFGDGGPDA